MNGFMNKLEAILDKYLTPVAEVLNNNIVISGIKDGMMSTLPATMIASVALILSSFPYLDQFCPPLSAAFKTFFGPLPLWGSSPCTLFWVLPTITARAGRWTNFTESPRR